MKLSKIFEKTAILLVSGLVSCGAQETIVKGPVYEEGEVHHVEGTLHEVNVTESNIPFATNGTCEYKIVYPADSDWANKAALFIQTHVYKVTGAKLPFVEYDGNYEYDSSQKIIVLANDSIMSQAGITPTDKPIGNAGYQLVTKNNSVFIYCHSGYGYVHAARMFLKQVIGYEIYSTDIVVYSKKGTTLPNMDIVEAPDIAYRLQSNKAETNTIYEMGFLTFTQAFYGKKGIPTQHNTFNWLPLDEYQAEHPYWYSQGSPRQLCYTARGDETEYNAMIHTIADRIIDYLQYDKDVGTVTITQQDDPFLCSCDACSRNVDKYGADSASIVLFMNDVDDIIQTHLQEVADQTGTRKRELNLCFFAYQKTEAPAVKKDASGNFVFDENGNYLPAAEEVKCHEHVVPYIAPIFSDYVRSFYHDTNIGVRQTVEGWKALSKKTYFWLYETNFSNYLYPFNSYSNMIETYRYVVDSGAEFMFNEGQHNNAAVTAFGRFKEFLNYRAQYDVNLSYNDIVEDFFSNYFRDASSTMKKLFYEIQDYMFELGSIYSTDLSGTIYEDVSQARFWPQNLLERWMGYCDEAMMQIQKYRETNVNLYNALYKNVLLESIFPRYALMELHRGKFTSTFVNDFVTSLRHDCELLNVTMAKESSPLLDQLESWII